jgi:hypothetical protein
MMCHCRGLGFRRSLPSASLDIDLFYAILPYLLLFKIITNHSIVLTAKLGVDLENRRITPTSWSEVLQDSINLAQVFIRHLHDLTILQHTLSRRRPGIGTTVVPSRRDNAMFLRPLSCAIQLSSVRRVFSGEASSWCVSGLKPPRR